MSSADVIRQHIEIVEGAGGPKARIAGSRIRAQNIVIWHEKLGLSPDEIVRDYPTITHADIYAALAYTIGTIATRSSSASWKATPLPTSTAARIQGRSRRS